MENKNLTFCDYINHPNFMRIKDEGEYFTLTIKSVVNKKTFDFYTIEEDMKTNSYSYEMSFQKSGLWSKID